MGRSEQMEESEQLDEIVDESGYGAAEDGDVGDVPEQVQAERRQPPTDEETEQDNYANTDEQAA
jgi:hypothetical protein